MSVEETMVELDEEENEEENEEDYRGGQRSQCEGC